jgi:hypothetical protein
VSYKRHPAVRLSGLFKVEKGAIFSDEAYTGTPQGEKVTPDEEIGQPARPHTIGRTSLEGAPHSSQQEEKQNSLFANASDLTLLVQLLICRL